MKEEENGFIRLKERDYEKSKEIFSKIVEKKPERASSHLGLGFSLLELGDITGAEKHLKASFSLFEAQNNLPEAYISIKELVDLRPEELDNNFNLLRTYIKLKFMKSFVKSLLEIMSNSEIEEEELKEHISLITPFIDDKDIKSLLTFKKETKSKDEEKLNPFENLELANLLFEIGSTDEAKNEYYKTARAFLNKDLKDKAQELYVKIKDLYPDDGGLKSLKQEIESYSKKKRIASLEERRANLEEMLPALKDENEARMRYSFAVTFKEYGRSGEAKKELNKIFELPKTHELIKAHVLLSQIYLDEEDNKKAIEVLENVISGSEFSGKDLAPLEYKLGTIYERMGKLPEALDIYEKAIDDDPEYLDLVEKIRKAKEMIEKTEIKVSEEAKEEMIESKEIKESKQVEKPAEVVIKKEEVVELRDRILYI